MISNSSSSAMVVYTPQKSSQEFINCEAEKIQQKDKSKLPNDLLYHVISFAETSVRLNMLRVSKECNAIVKQLAKEEIRLYYPYIHAIFTELDKSQYKPGIKDINGIISQAKFRTPAFDTRSRKQIIDREIERIKVKEKIVEMNDDELVLEAVRQNGLALQYAPDIIRTDREIVLAAVRQNVLALRNGMYDDEL